MNTASTASFELALPASHAPLRLVSFRGRERVSSPFRFRVRAATSLGDSGDDLHESLLGETASLVFFGAYGPERTVTAMIAQVTDHSFTDLGGRSLDLLLVPHLSRLRHRRTRRIFQEKTTLEIASRILGEHKVIHRATASVSLPPRGYTVQYDETDLAFLERLFAEDGLFYFFEHPLSPSPGETERLVIAAAAHDYPMIAGTPELSYQPFAHDHALHADESSIRRFTVQSRVRPRATLSRGYDHKNPKALLQASAPPSIDPLRSPDRSLVYDFEGEYEDDPGRRPASVRLEQARRKAEFAEGESACRRLVPGHTFTLRGHEAPTRDGAWAVTRIDHEGYASDAVPTGRSTYQNTFRAVRADRPLRPLHKPFRPRQTAETATVVGPAGKDIHTDALGRVKVQFHWDLEGAMDDRATCWLRVAQAWAGAGWGAQFIPRIGMEVVVTYLGGDLDRPLVTGCVYNATHLPPFPPAENPTKSGIRTQTSPFGTGANELSFQDAAGMEQIFVYAERNYDEVVRAQRTSHVGGGSASRIDGSVDERIGHDLRREIGGKRDTLVGRAETISIGGDRRETVAGNAHLDVEGAQNIAVSGPQSTQVFGGRVVVVGTAEAPSASEHIVYGPSTLSSDTSVTIRAGSSMRLVCGDARIELMPDKILLIAPTVELRPGETLTLGTADGPTLTVEDEGVEVLSKKLRVFTDSAALEMDSDFKAKGDSIKLGYNPQKPSRDSDSKEPETKPLDLVLTDYFLDPYSEKTYHLTASGLRFEGKTDKDGKLKHDIPKEATTATLRLWTAVYPEGPQRLYQIKLMELAPPDSIEGAQQRLKNLGYYTGPVDGIENGLLTAAIRELQIDHAESHGLSPTGALDEGTAGALEEIHRS